MRLTRLILLFAVLSAVLSSLGQVPQRINFQGIARDGGGAPLANHVIGIRLTVVDSASGGADVYREVHSTTTTSSGAFNITIGEPLFVVSIPGGVAFQDIPWVTGEKYLRIDFDTTVALTFPFSLGTIPFSSVPYAFAAETISSIDDSGVQDGDLLQFDGALGKWTPIASDSIGSSTSPPPPLQTLSVSPVGDTLRISGGNFVIVPGISAANDTSIFGTYTGLQDSDSLRVQFPPAIDTVESFTGRPHSVIVSRVTGFPDSVDITIDFYYSTTLTYRGFWTSPPPTPSTAIVVGDVDAYAGAVPIELDNGVFDFTALPGGGHSLVYDILLDDPPGSAGDNIHGSISFSGSKP